MTSGGRFLVLGTALFVLGGSLAPPAMATSETELVISTVSRSGGTVSLSGTLTVGDDHRAPARILSDPEGDDVDAGLIPNGLDIGDVFIGQKGGTVVISISTYDMPPLIDAQAPTFSYLLWARSAAWPPVRLVAGHVGGTASRTDPTPIEPGKFFRICRGSAPLSSPLGLQCYPTPGTITDNLVTIEWGRFGPSAGEVVELVEDATLGSPPCPGVCSAWDPMVAKPFYGDVAGPADGYIVPGGVRVAVAPADMPDDEITFGPLDKATVSGGQWSANVGGSHLIPGVQYKAAAQSCAGAESDPRCVVTTKLFTA